MKILITGPGTFHEVYGEPPEVGRKYNLEDATHGSSAQNKAFHSLLDAFWKWMFLKDRFRAVVDEQHPENGYYNFASKDAGDFKIKFKIHYCHALKYYRFMDENFHWVKVKDFGEIPNYAIRDYANGNDDRIERVVKSWKEFTMTQRREAIDVLKALIIAFKCDDKKVHKILDGMEKVNEETNRKAS